jgi:soluble lytic murein transglycosylase-like protein
LEESIVIRRGAWALVLLLTACAAPRAPLAPVPPPPPSVHASAPATRAPSKPLDATRLPPFDGETQVVEEPLRGVRLIDLTVQPDDLWQRIRIGFGMPDLDNQRVRDMMAYYAARPDYLQRMFERSRRYLYHIVDELEKRGMPTELALLPMVESAYNPMAYSRSHASGIWQFIPPTGKRYSLEQGWWYDERRDIVASTNAALDYLQDLYDMHGDWQLALASYNWGENAVARAIEKNRKAGLPTDYADLKMPPETRNYIPKLQALKNIINDPKPFGVVLDPIPNKPYFVAVDGTGAIDVRLAAKLAEMPVDDFIALNPGFNRPLIPTSLDSRIVLPADKVEVFRANLEKYDHDALVSWKTYHPKRGERARPYRAQVPRSACGTEEGERHPLALSACAVAAGRSHEQHCRGGRRAAADHVRAAASRQRPGARRAQRRHAVGDLAPLRRLGRRPAALEPPSRHAAPRAAHRRLPRLAPPPRKEALSLLSRRGRPRPRARRGRRPSPAFRNSAS